MATPTPVKGKEEVKPTKATTATASATNGASATTPAPAVNPAKFALMDTAPSATEFDSIVSSTAPSSPQSPLSKKLMTIEVGVVVSVRFSGKAQGVRKVIRYWQRKSAKMGNPRYFQTKTDPKDRNVLHIKRVKDQPQGAAKAAAAAKAAKG